MALLVSVFHAAQACLSAYTGLLSYTSITKLQKYEETSERAAQYSNTAASELYKTRATQASGAIATISSLLCSVALAAASSTSTWQTAILMNVASLSATSFAYKYMSSFWQAKAKVPFVTDFNDAITTSNQMLSALAVLTITWGVSSLIYGFQLA